MNQKRYLIGLFSICSIAITLILSISQNAWFNWTQNALSDLGSSRATNPWIFNYGLMITGVLGITYFSKLRKLKLNIHSKIGLIVLIINFFLSILIGIFPSGNTLHYPISITFFIILPIATTTFGIGRLKINKKKGFTILLATLIGLLAAIIALILFKGVAVAETIGISVLASIVFIEK